MTFDEIYQIVLNSDESELEERLKDVFLDVLDNKPPYYTVAGKLAAEDNGSMAEKYFLAEKLRRLGAAPKYIALGYAIANSPMADTYRQAYPTCTDNIALGFAYTNNHKKVKEYRTQHQASPSAIAAGHAVAGNDKKVREYLDIYQADLDVILRGYALVDNQEKIDSYLLEYYPDTVPDFITDAILSGYVLAGNDEKVKEALKHDSKKIYVITYHYALAGNDEKVEEYCDEEDVSQLTNVAAAYARANNHQRVNYYYAKGADASLIASAYASVGNHVKVAEYEGFAKQSATYNAQKTAQVIARGYAHGGFHDDAEIYRKAYSIPVNYIAHTYALTGQHQKVEEFRKKHNADVEVIAQGYDKFKKAPPFYKAINILKEYAEGSAVIEVMKRLQKGEDNKWNPYWMNSKDKLHGIVSVINKQKAGFNLAEMLNDKTSDLYRAINKSRITPLTIFGTPRWDKSKSLTATKRAMSSLRS
ncbi:MAG: hypothetical protein Q8M03_14875 [Legionella sp.]|nr:hypothetical protein [Legionella sp.]